jgi:hypothetical protein
MRTNQLATVAVFTAFAIGSDFALTDALNVKLVDPIVFSVAFVFGLSAGVWVGVLSELIWGAVSPWGFGGYLIPFLVAGEVLYALAGWAASKAWKLEGKRFSSMNIYIGAALAVCAFVWDLETNAAVTILGFWPHPTLQDFVATEGFGIPFTIAHEVSDLFMGAILAPLIIFYASRSRFARPGKPVLRHEP